MSQVSWIELTVLLVIVLVLLLLIIYDDVVDIIQSVIILVAVFVVTYHLLQYKLGSKEGFKKTAYIEDFDVIPAATQAPAKADVSYTNLKVYLSSLSKNSFDGSGVLINNIADTDTSHHTFVLSKQVAFDASGMSGIPLNKTYITGPLSSSLGINGLLSYSIVWYARTKGVDNTNAGNMFFLYGNTSDNSRTPYLSVDLIKDSPSTGVNTIKLTHGNIPNTPTNKFPDTTFVENATNSTFKAIECSATTTTTCSPNWHLYVLVKDSNAVTLYVDNAAILQMPITDSFTQDDLEFSNKNMYINRGGHWNADLMLWMAYNRAITAADMANIKVHISDQTTQQSTMYQNAQAIIQQYQAKEIARSQQAQTCPFVKSDICSVYCDTVNDWTSHSNIMKNSSDQCLRTIYHYCDSKDGKNDPGCLNWQKDRISSVLGCSMSNSTITVNTDSSRLKDVLQTAVDNVQTMRDRTSPLRIVGSHIMNTDHSISESILTKNDVIDIIRELNLSAPGINALSSSVNLQGSNVHLGYLPGDVNPNTGMTVGIDNNKSKSEDQRYEEIISRYRKDVIDSKKTDNGFFTVLNRMLGL